MQYIITALDYKDDEALERRLACREKHLENVKQMIKASTFLSGGAMLVLHQYNNDGVLDTNRKMIGSSLHVEFENRKDLEHWLATDVYTTQQVWENIDIQECKLVPINNFLG